MGSEVPGTERQHLRRVAYANGDRLRDRASIYDHQSSGPSLVEWVASLADWSDGAPTLDLGCGPGTHLATLGTGAFGVDLSAGMVREAAGRRPVAVADGAHLPFPDATFDRVLAAHVLYHCPDIAVALGEVRRVLRHGVLVAVTNGVDHLEELHDLHAQATGARRERISRRFDAASAPDALGAVFDDVEPHLLDGEVRLTSPEPAVAYLRSLAGWSADRQDHEVVRAVEDGVTTEVRRAGAFVARTRVVLESPDELLALARLPW